MPNTGLKNLKEKAIFLRKKGQTYSEILSKIPVAKSTLSLWLRSVSLSKTQKHQLTEKKKLGQLKGGLVRKTKRIKNQQVIYINSAAEVGKLSKRELWLIGIALYWAEGTKEKEYRPGTGIHFSNSDPSMIRIFIRWLILCCKINKDQINFCIYIHETHNHRLSEVQRYWSEITNFPIEKFNKIYLKKHNIETNRKNTGSLYNGLLRVKVYASSELNRKVTGWTKGICKVNNCGVV